MNKMVVLKNVIGVSDETVLSSSRWANFLISGMAINVGDELNDEK